MRKCTLPAGEVSLIYRNLSSYLHSKYGSNVYKLCIDGGFTCPNRDGSCGTGGCIFCGERGSGEHMNSRKSIGEQVVSYFRHHPKHDRVIAYFQNFTNTYAPVNVLKERYDSALCDSRIVGLSIGTRPDCIDEENVNLIASYAERYETWVELGFQTAVESTVKLINRGYGNEVFTRAVNLLGSHGIPVVVHIILGLPGEGDAELARTMDFLCAHNIWGIKVHSVFVMKNTVLEKMYLEGKFTVPPYEDFVRRAAYVIARVNPDTVIHRLTGECPEDVLVAPHWNVNKNRIIGDITECMERNNWTQGCLYNRITRL